MLYFHMKRIFTFIVVATMSLSYSFAGNDTGDDIKPVKSSFQRRNNSSKGTWFATVGVGGQVTYGDHNKQTSFGKRITPTFQITGGKWLNDSFGARLSVNIANAKGLTQIPALSTGKIFRASDGLYHQDFNYLNVHADFLFNWTNDAYGVDPSRLYNLIPYAGVGILTVTNYQKGTYFAPNLGVLQSFRVTDKVGINLDVKGTLAPDKFDGEVGGRNFEGVLSAVVGVRYSF